MIYGLFSDHSPGASGNLESSVPQSGSDPKIGNDKRACIDWSGQLPDGRRSGSNRPRFISSSARNARLSLSAWADQQVLRGVDSGARVQLSDGPSSGSNRDHFLQADLSGVIG